MAQRPSQTLSRLAWPSALKTGRPLTVREAYKTGQLISEKVRAGHGRFEGPSVRDLAQLLNSSSATLYRAVKVYEVVTKYDLKERLDELSPTLLHNVERLPGPKRKQFLQRAMNEGWSKREIVRRVTGAPATDTRARNSRRAKEATLLGTLRRLSKLPLDAPFDKRELTGVQVWHAQRSIRAIRRHLKKWESTL